MEYKNLKSTKVLGCLSSLIAVLESLGDIDGSMAVAGFKQRYLTGDVCLSTLKDGVFPYVVGAVRDLTAAMNDFRACPEIWKTTILYYKYHLDLVCKLL